MKKHYFLIFFLLNVCFAQDALIDTKKSVALEVKKNLMTLLQYEIKQEYGKANNLMTKNFLKCFKGKNEYLQWAKRKFKVLNHTPSLKFSMFFIRKKMVENKAKYLVQFVLVDQKGKIVIDDDDSCYLFTEEHGMFKADIFIYDCNPID